MVHFLSMSVQDKKAYQQESGAKGANTNLKATNPTVLVLSYNTLIFTQKHNYKKKIFFFD